MSNKNNAWRLSTPALTLTLTMISLTLGGCQTDAQTGTLLGAGIGALAGQAIGHDTGATVLGTAIGASLGYMIGNESDKQPFGEYRYREYRDYGNGGFRDRRPRGRRYDRRNDCYPY